MIYDKTIYARFLTIRQCIGAFVSHSEGWLSPIDLSRWFRKW